MGKPLLIADISNNVLPKYKKFRDLVWAARKPAINAPRIIPNEFLDSVQIKPTAIPGRTACERVSPKSESFLVTTKLPMSPQPLPIKIIPERISFTE